MKALIVDFLLESYSFQQLDELVEINDCKGRNRLDMSYVVTQVDVCFKEASAGIQLYMDLVRRLSGSNSAASSYLQLVEPIIHSTTFSYADVFDLSAKAGDLIKNCSELKQIHNGLVRRFYEQIVLGNFLNMPDGAKITAPARIDDCSSDSDMVGLQSTKTIENITRDLCEKNSISLNVVNEVGIEVCKLIDILSDLRKKLLQASLGTTSVSFDRVIEESAIIADGHGFGAAIARTYGEYLSEQILFNPGKVFGKYLSSFREAFEQSFELAKMEREVVIKFKIPQSWCISPRIMRLERLSTLAEITSDPKTACLLAAYYERPVFLEYDLEKSLFWATVALTQGGVDSLPAISKAELSNGDPLRAITFLKKHFRETGDSESAYLLACLLFNKNDQKHFEFELAKRLLSLSAQNHHPAALCLTAFFSRKLWNRTGSDSDLESALNAYKKSASLDFGLAKIALEEFELDGWQRPDDDTSNTPLRDLTGNATEKEMFAYLKTILGKGNKIKANLDDLKDIAQQKNLMCFDFIIGQIVNRSDPRDPTSFYLIEKAARKGHPEACLFLSKQAEKEKKFGEAIFWEELRLRNDILFKTGSRELHPFARLHALKVTQQASLSIR